ncbi:MAG: helix-turn-helix transcriptional regulator [Lachnospiraceae bacterium]|nr:helix-turn-helix transcriptional regulator [Lachnospiraceae bacterium]
MDLYDHKKKKANEFVDYETKFAERLSQLRLIHKASCREMSLALGQSEGYINKIENGKTLPSMQNFFYICNYLDVTPEEFFTFFPEDSKNQRFFDKFARLSEKQQEHILLFIEDLQ